MNDPLRTTLDALNGVRENGSGHAACCPAHEDNSPSLSVGTSAAGAVLLNCHAGCETEAILDAAGLEWADLYPDDYEGDGAVTHPAPRPQPPQETPEPQAEGIGREQAEAWCSDLLDGEKGAHRRAREYLVERRGIDAKLLRKRRVGLRYDKRLWWIVFPLDVEEGRVTLRKERGFDPAAMDWKRDDGGKPFVRTKGGGSCLVLLANDRTAGETILAAGETDGFSARSNGFNVAFGSAGESTFKDEWARQTAGLEIAGRGVVVCYDGDETGRENAPKVARKLAAEGVPVRIARLPDGKDVNDVLTTGGGPERLREIVAEATPYEPPAEAQTDESEREKQDDASANVKASAESARCNGGSEEDSGWHPFPVEALPGPAAGYVRASAAAVGCAPAMVALPLLSALSAAVGSAARLRLKRSWREPGTLWTMLVAPSGSAKSPALKQALRPIYRREREAKKEFERQFSAWKANEEATEEEKPGRHRYRTGDATPEGVMKLLGKNERGIFLARNELGAWLGSFDRYAQGAADLQFWIEVWDGIQASRNRAGDGNVTVDHPAVPITGTIQPGALKEKLTPVHFESGFAARFLLACPPSGPLAWTEADVTRDAEGAFEDLLNSLYALGYGTEVELDTEAKRQWVRFYNRANLEAHDFEDGAARAVAMKAIRYGARLALLIHLGRRAAGETGADAVELESMARGLRLARWLRRETLRVHQRLDLVTAARPPMMRFLDALTTGRFETKEARALADDFDVTARTVDNWLKELTERGSIEKLRRGVYRTS